LLSETGWPNCVGDCTYHNDYGTFSTAKSATDDIQGGSTYAEFNTAGIAWSSVEIGFFRSDCSAYDEFTNHDVSLCTWNWADTYDGWTIDNVYYVRDGNWGFSNYEFTVQIPFFPRGGDYVIVAYYPQDKTNYKILYADVL
jgi:hypothetical protein